MLRISPWVIDFGCPNYLSDLIPAFPQDHVNSRLRRAVSQPIFFIAGFTQACQDRTRTSIYVGFLVCLFFYLLVLKLWSW